MFNNAHKCNRSDPSGSPQEGPDDLGQRSGRRCRVGGGSGGQGPGPHRHRTRGRAGQDEAGGGEVQVRQVHRLQESRRQARPGHQGSLPSGFAPHDTLDTRHTHDTQHTTHTTNLYTTIADDWAGVDLYWDNVGGPTLDAVLLNLNDRARIIMCGQVRTHNTQHATPNTRLHHRTRTNTTLTRFLANG